jgi:hypothetical protein
VAACLRARGQCARDEAALQVHPGAQGKHVAALLPCDGDRVLGEGAEQARRKAGIAITRPPGRTWSSPAAPAPASPAPPPPARLYRDLGLLCDGNLIELHAADL